MFTSKAIVPVVLVVALAMLLQSMQATAAAAPPLPAICMREARELCHSSSSLVQVRACLAEQAGVSPGCLSALKMSRQGNLRSKRRAEQRTRLLKEARKWWGWMHGGLRFFCGVGETVSYPPLCALRHQNVSTLSNSLLGKHRQR